MTTWSKKQIALYANIRNTTTLTIIVIIVLQTITKNPSRVSFYATHLKENIKMKRLFDYYVKEVDKARLATLQASTESDQISALSQWLEKVTQALNCLKGEKK